MLRKLLTELLLLNNSAYTFASGISVALSVNIFTTLCFEKRGIFSCSHLYIAAAAFLVVGILCMYVAVRVGRMQNYILEKNIVEYEKKKKIVGDFTRESSGKWIAVFLFILLFLLVGIGGLGYNFVTDSNIVLSEEVEA